MKIFQLFAFGNETSVVPILLVANITFTDIFQFNCQYGLIPKGPIFLEMSILAHN